MDPASPESRAVPTTISASALRPLRHRLGLRSRVTTAFALGALALSSALAGTTYFVVRASIVNQQLSALQHQALANAVLLRGELRVPTAYIPALITTLDSGPNTGSLIYSMNSWYPSSLTLSPRQLPSALRARVLAGLPARQVVRLAGSEQLVVGVPIPPENSSRTGNAAYFEIFDLSGLVQTLHILLVALTIAALITTIAGRSWAVGRLAVRSGRCTRQRGLRWRSPEGVWAHASRAQTSPIWHHSHQRSIRWWTNFKSESSVRLASPLTSTMSSVPRSRRLPIRSRSSRPAAMNCRPRRARHLIS